MKVRVDFVTNSSSSSFICLKLKDNLEEKVLEANGIPSDSDELYDYYREKLDCDGEVSLKGGMDCIISEGYIVYTGKTLNGSDLENKTLSQLKQKMVDNFKTVYGIEANIKDIYFDYGEYES